MTRKQVRAEFNNFIKGLITEASPLNFPQNASFDEENFELDKTGVRRRRLGMAIEEGGTTYSTGMVASNLDTNIPKTYQWKAAGGNARTNILVCQFKNTLWFFDMSQEPLTTNGFLTTLTLSGFPTDKRYSFATVDGTLVVVAGIGTVCVITYTGSSFNPSYERISVRDLWGVEVVSEPLYETDVSYRGGISSDHYYNLQNQSWGIPRKESNGVVNDPAWVYFNAYNKWPSNSEVVWPALQYQPVSASQVPFERIYSNLWEEVLGANVKAAKGYFIIDLLRRGVSREQAFVHNYNKYPILHFNAVTLPLDYTPNGATIVTDFAGRVFYAGFNGEVVQGDGRSPNLNNYIFFSQLVRNKKDFTKCYSEGDPTSRENNEVIDTDGGFIRISDAGNIIGMVGLASSLIVIADNGVWSVTGGSDYGFTPTNMKVDRLSSFGGVSQDSIVVSNGKAFFWGEEGIYIVEKNQFGEFMVGNISEDTIQTLLDNIPIKSKQNCIGIYDGFEKKIKWLYKIGELFTSDSITYELILDTKTGAFTKKRIYNPTDNSVEVVSAFSPNGVKDSEDTLNVLAGFDSVVVGADQVIIPDTREVVGVKEVRYLALSKFDLNINFSFSYYYNEDFLDWPHLGGRDAFAYLITGETTGGDSSVKKQLNYVTIHMYRTEQGVDVNLSPLKQSSCRMRFRWGWSNTDNSKQWSSLQQVYRYPKVRYVTGLSDTYDTGYRMITTKNKIRGSGKAFAMSLETEPLKDCQVVGWNLDGNASTAT
jgi:hypothetical protein